MDPLLPEDNVLVMVGCQCNFMMKVEVSERTMKDLCEKNYVKCPTCRFKCKKISFATASRAVADFEWSQLEKLSGCDTNAQVLQRYEDKIEEDKVNQKTQDNSAIRRHNEECMNMMTTS